MQFVGKTEEAKASLKEVKRELKKAKEKPIEVIAEFIDNNNASITENYKMEVAINMHTRKTFVGG